MHSWQFEAIGTVWTIALEVTPSDEALLAVKSSVAERIETFDKTYSRFREDSLVQQWRTPGTYAMPKDGYVLFKFYHDLHSLTDGAVTPLIGAAMENAGYDSSYSFSPRALSDTPAWNEALHFTRTQLTIKQPIVLDVGAAGKGYLIDILVDLISQNPSIESISINAGGDIRHWSRPKSEPLRIGLENPHNFKEIIGVSELENQSLCASAGSRRAWKGFHHIINPHTKASPHQVIATWVKADSTMIADGLATALFFIEPEALNTFSFDYAVLAQDNSLTHSAHMLQEVFTT